MTTSLLPAAFQPRVPDIPGVDHPKVKTYQEVLGQQLTIGKSVALLGAGGIGFDMCEYLSHEGPSITLDKKAWMKEWGVDITNESRGGLTPAEIEPSPRKIYMLQRKSSHFGKGLNKTTGWVHRAVAKMKGVEAIGGVSYDKVDDDGLHITITDGKDNTITEQRVLDVDDIVLCTGQLSNNTLF